MNLLSTNIQEFRGTTHPYLSVSSFSQPTFDDDLLSSMMEAWRRVHVRGRPSRGDRRLFRALSVAYEACRVPQAMDNPLYDHGKHCSLWVSAFETLAHPGTWVGFQQVVDLVGKRNLADTHLKRKVRMKVSMKGGKPKYQALNVAQRLYVRLYGARNKFLHGGQPVLGDPVFAPRLCPKWPQGWSAIAGHCTSYFSRSFGGRDVAESIDARGKERG